MSVDGSSVALANALIRPVNSSADTLVVHSANNPNVQGIHHKTSARWTNLCRNLSVDQIDVTLRVSHDKRIMGCSEDGDSALFVCVLQVFTELFGRF